VQGQLVKVGILWFSSIFYKKNTYIYLQHEIMYLSSSLPYHPKDVHCLTQASPKECHKGRHPAEYRDINKEVDHATHCTRVREF
jgi:hypothetical protein